MINAAMVGLGWWGRHIIACLGDSAKIRVRRGVDLDIGRHGSLASKHGLILGTDLDEALGDPDIGAVLIATPHSLHEDQAVRAAGAGKHVFCEKPLALTKVAAERVAEACAVRGVQLGIGHERRFEPAMVEIKRLIDTGALGEILHVEANFSHDKLAHVPPEGWRAAAEETPAAGMTATGIHLTDAFINMIGDVAEVYALTARRVMTSGGGDELSVQFRFKNGVIGSFSSQLATPLYMRYAVFGSAGWAEARDGSHPSELGRTRLTVCRGEKLEEVMELEDIETVRANLEAFADAAEGRAGYPFTAHQMVHNIAVLEAISRSAETGKPVAVA